MRAETLRLIFATSARLNLRLTSLDIKTAYLSASLEDGVEIYAKQPKGFETFGPNGEKMVWKLKKALYGLKQGGARFEATLVEHLLQIGFERSVYDPCLFQLKGEVMLFLAAYVDDIIIATASEELRTKVMDDLMKRFKIKDQGDLSWMLGMAIQQDLEKGTVRIHQELYAQDVILSSAALVSKELLQETSEYTDSGLREAVGRRLREASGRQTVRSGGAHRLRVDRADLPDAIE